eukprot:58967_1
MCKCEFIQNNVKYIRVIIIGLLSVTAITGIYGFMSNVQSIQVRHSNILPWKNKQTTEIHDGIRCVNINAWQTSASKCNNMAEQMAKSTDPKWQCSLHTDYSSKALFQDNYITVFRNVFICLVIFSITY